MESTKAYERSRRRDIQEMGHNAPEVAAALFAAHCPACNAPRLPEAEVPPFGVNWRCRACGAQFYKHSPVPAIPEVAVAPHLVPTVHPDVYFPKVCFMKAFEYVRDHIDEDDIWLCHGLWKINYYLHTIGLADAIHAWVEIGADTVFDPNWQRFYNKADYYRALEIIPKTRHTPREAVRLHATHDSYGPYPAERKNDAARPSQRVGSEARCEPNPVAGDADEVRSAHPRSAEARASRSGADGATPIRQGRRQRDTRRTRRGNARTR